MGAGDPAAEGDARAALADLGDALGLTAPQPAADATATDRILAMASGRWVRGGELARAFGDHGVNRVMITKLHAAGKLRRRPARKGNGFEYRTVRELGAARAAGGGR